MRRSGPYRLAAAVISTALSMAAAWFPVPVAARQAPTGESVYQRYAPIDLTGMWVSIVTEDWQSRMLTPPKGDFHNLPLTKAAQEAASRIDMAGVEAAGRACEAYGAPVIMREPGRIRISWTDAATLRIDTDSGQQTRLLHFDRPPAGGPRSLQGYSAAEWQYANGFDPLRAGEATGQGTPRSAGGSAPGGANAPGRAGASAPGGANALGSAGASAPAGGGRRGAGGRGAPAAVPSGGRLKVTTTNLAAGFLRKNGVPYSEDVALTEYFNLLSEPNGTRWLVVTTIVHDPRNLAVDYITSTNFRQESDISKWAPRACSLR